MFSGRRSGSEKSVSLVNGFESVYFQGCISCLTCSYPEMTEDHVLTGAYVKIFRTITRNAVNKSVWRKKDCFWLPLNKHAVNIWLSSLRIRAHLSWRKGKHLHVRHVLRTYPTCSYPGYQDTTTYAALTAEWLNAMIVYNFKYFQDDLVWRAAPGDPHEGQRHCGRRRSLLLPG